MCVVDDAQWLDRASAQTLAFVARRLLAERVALVFAAARARRRGRARRAAGAARRGPGDDDARQLLDSASAGRSTSGCATGSSPRARGNPLALLELPRGLTPAELAGGFGLPGARPLAQPHRAELPAAARAAAGARRNGSLLLGGGGAGRRRDPAVARGRAARDRADAAGAGRGGGPGRDRRAGAVPPSAGALGGLPGGVRARATRASHRALAEATDPELDPDRRAWHRAHAATGLDEDGRRRAGALGRPGRRRAAASRPRPRSWSGRPS